MLWNLGVAGRNGNVFDLSLKKFFVEFWRLPSTRAIRPCTRAVIQKAPEQSLSCTRAVIFCTRAFIFQHESSHFIIARESFLAREQSFYEFKKNHIFET